MADPGGIPFGHFTLGKRLARGGMAEVFLARQRGPQGFDWRVAVKRILPHLADAADFVRMFLDEARLAARLSHPNIVHIYELGSVEGDFFIAMEYVDGIHAGQLIKHAEVEAVPPELVARVAADAAGALAYAHRLTDADGRLLQLVHRDVSPQNIMVSSDGIVKLVDFGIAKAVSKAEETRPGVVKGKYAYMSPEQTTGKPLDGRSDVFSLGVVMWEILAGRNIVERGDVVEAMKVMRDGKFRPIREVAPRVPAPLAEAVNRALTLRKEERPTATQLQVMLEEFIKGAPRLATPVQLAEWIRPRFPRGQATGAHDAVEAMPHHTRPTAATPLRPGRPATERADVTSDAAAISIAVSMPGAPALPAKDAPHDGEDGDDAYDGLATIERPPSGQHAVDDGLATIERPPRGRARGHQAPREPQTETVKPLPPPRKLALPPPVPRAPTVDDIAFDVPVGVGDGTTRLHPPSMSRVRRRAAWPMLLAALFALTVIAIVAAVLTRRGPDELAGVPRVTDARDAVVTVVALDGGELTDGGAATTTDAGATDAASAVDGGVTITALDGGDGEELVIETATLEVVTRPAGARIQLADQPPRTSPTVMTGLPVGRVTFTVSKDGYAPLQRTVTLAAGEHRTLELALVHPTGAAPRKLGYLTVRTEPYSLVYLGKRLLGETPFAGVELPVGTHTLVFRHPRKKPVTRRVTITAGKTAKLSVKLP